MAEELPSIPVSTVSKMKCRNPFIKDGSAYGCGQCLPCRVDKSRIWTHRIMLEAALHSDNAFVTLTYDDDHMPVVDRRPGPSQDLRGALVPKEMQDWLKRIRKAVEPVKLRYFGVGEYGDDSWRPHFHLALFGFASCQYGRSRYSKIFRNCCVNCDLVRDTWGRGMVLLGDLNESSAQYVSGYVTKKMTAKDDIRLKGLHPEFARMSLKPGIGADAMWDVASTLLQFNLDETQVDVPSTLRHGKRIFPLGRYLQRRLRKNVGKEEAAPQEVLDRIKAELQPLRDSAFENSRSFKKEIVKAADQAVANMEAKRAIFKQRKVL